MSNNTVLLVHGIWHHGGWLEPLAQRLQQQGLEPRIFSYDSLAHGADAALPQLKEVIQHDKPTYMLGHSLGGLMALHALQRIKTSVKRLVCLGAPRQGSTTAQWMSINPWWRPALGASQPMLTRDVCEWKGETEVGMIAGTVRRGLGQFVAPLWDTNDGMVRLKETQAPWLKDHQGIPYGHSELLFAPEVASLAGTFFKEGKFGGEMVRPST